MKKIFTLIMMVAATISMQAQGDTWSVAGVATLCGEDAAWKADTTLNDMTTTDGTNFTLVKEGCKLKANTEYEYKFIKNHSDWYGDSDDPTNNAAPNYAVKVDANGEYKVTFTFNATTLKGEATTEKTGEAEFGEDTWTLVGAGTLFGTSWDLDNNDNNMTTTDGTTFTLTKENVTLERGVNYEYKVAQNHSWDVSYGNGKDNKILTVDENGIYTVVFTFVNDDTHSLSAEATKTGDAVIAEKTWVICGVEALCGSSWDPTDSLNVMEKVDEGKYELTRYNVELKGLTEYEYKVAANFAWDESYGADGGSGNQIFQVDEDGTYDVTFEFIVESKTLSASAEVSDPAGINNVNNNTKFNAAIYNMQGQRVQSGFRGLIIKNGHKMIAK